MGIRTTKVIAWIAAFFTILVGLTANVSADTDVTSEKGNELIGYCSTKNYNDDQLLWSVCVTWVFGIESGLETGVFDDFSMNFIRKGKVPTAEDLLSRFRAVEGYCMPNDVTRQQMALVVTKYLENHPETLNQDQAIEVEAAFKEAWPCSHK